MRGILSCGRVYNSACISEDTEGYMSVYVCICECGYIEQGLCEYCVCMMREGVGGCVHGVGK